MKEATRRNDVSVYLRCLFETFEILKTTLQMKRFDSGPRLDRHVTISLTTRFKVFKRCSVEDFFAPLWIQDVFKGLTVLKMPLTGMLSLCLI